MDGIPKEVRIPPQLIHRSRLTHHASFVEALLLDVSQRFGTQVVEDESLGFPSPLSFEFSSGPVRGAIDYNSIPELPPCAGNYPFWFKFQSVSSHTPFGNVKPFTPISFHNWKQYRELERDIRYDAEGEIVLNCQRTRINIRAEQWAADLTRRRSTVRELLRETYGDLVDISQTDQVSYWKKSADCLVSVHVPGLWNNMLDRAQLQLWGFGVCTVSPVLYTRLPVDDPVPGVHYIACRNDYSDLVEKIEWCRENRDRCREVGIEARKLFARNCTPEAVWCAVGEEMARAAIGAV